MNKVPYVGNPEEKQLECNYALIEDAHFSEEFIEQFCMNFGSFLHNLETVALQLHHKQQLLATQISQVVAKQNEASSLELLREKIEELNQRLLESRHS